MTSPTVLAPLSHWPEPAKLETAEELEMQEEMVTERQPQWCRAYELWHDEGMLLQKMGVELQVREEGIPDEEPLDPETVISYVVWAVQADLQLPVGVESLRELVYVDTPE
ncbi:hypothetical protein DXG01_009100 [Tephrocybe rancida]|nr:hypothetical protein DXG01_009100 [Tephrocybe rancida]